MGFTIKTDKLNEIYERYLNEDSTKDAYETLKAIIGSTKDEKDGTGKEIHDMAVGMEKTYKKNKGFSPDQAKWIYNTSKSLFK
jgi:hypothetical protein